MAEVPDLQVSAFTAEDAFAYWASRPFLKPTLRASVANADIVVVPYEGFRDFAGPVFPAGTEELFATLRDELPQGLKLELAAEDSDYHEVALHHDVVTLATFLVKHVAAPVVVSIVVAFLKKRLGSRFSQSHVKTSLIVQKINRSEARSVKLSYDGPAPEFERMMTKALTELSSKNGDE